MQREESLSQGTRRKTIRHPRARRVWKTAARRLFFLLAASWTVTAASGCGGGEESAAPPDTASPFVVMSYNILVDFPVEGFDAWETRKAFVAEAFQRHDPDLIGLQESSFVQIEDLLAICPGYLAAYIDPFATDASILFRENRFTEVERGGYWLSPTPDRPWSRGFGNFFPRMVVWVRLRDASTGKDLTFVNTHFDSTSPSPERSAELLLDRTEPHASDGPVIVAGDFNADPGSEAYRILVGDVQPGGTDGFRLVDTFALAPGVEIVAPEGAPARFDPSERIDHMFVAARRFTVQRWSVDMTGYGTPRMYPSDHFPVVARVTLAGAPGQ